jgi:hypothetical protein
MSIPVEETGPYRKSILRAMSRNPFVLGSDQECRVRTGPHVALRGVSPLSAFGQSAHRNDRILLSIARRAKVRKFCAS